ncbi:MAG: DUF5717 family protein [Lachnospiraceae bacterium]|nr:DUF5717 family protein [Lachnospiraceae bacterium]
MKDKLDEINRGKFEYQLPEIIVSEEIIDKSVGYGESYSGSFTISNDKNRVMKGIVYSSHEKVRIKEASFVGKISTIEFEFAGYETIPNEVVNGQFDIVSDCGEIQIPYCFTILKKVFESSNGPVSDLTSFAELAKKDYQEALMIFNSPQFVKVVLGGDYKNEILYRSLIKGTSKSIEMEEFLIAVRKKSPVTYSANKDKAEYIAQKEPIKDKIVIKKKNWGYCELEVKTDSPYVHIEKTKITLDDFVNDQYELVFSIYDEELEGNKQTKNNKYLRELNIAHIEIVAAEQRFKVELTINPVKLPETEENKDNSRRYKIQLVKNYILFRNNKMELEEYIKEGENIVQKLSFLEDNGINELYRIHLEILSGKKKKAQEMLSQVESHFDEKESVDVLERCGYLYLKTLVCEDDMVIRIATNTIMNFYEGEHNDWQILWMLLYVNKRYDNNFELKIKDMKKQFEAGCTSPIIYYEACGLYNKDATLLNTLGKFELQVINWGVKNNCITEDTALAFANLALRQKEFSNLLYGMLTKLYEKYHLTDILTAICSMLIKAEKYNVKYHDWYKKGVEEQLKITYLYEGYMYSYDASASNTEILPESLLMYFSYNSNLADTRKIILYSSVIRNKKNSFKTYELYKPQIKTFMIKMLKQHVINESMKIIYEDLLDESDIDEEVAAELPFIMFRYDINCYNDNYVGAFVVHKVIAIEQYAAFSEGKAQINIYADGTEIFLVDKEGNRYLAKNSYVLKKLFNGDKYIDKCYEYNKEDGMLIVNIGDKIDNYIREDFEGMVIRKQMVGVLHLRDEFKRRYLYELIKYTFDKGETELLDYYLSIIDIKNLSPKERSYVLEYMILRGFKERVLEAIEKYGFYRIPVDRLVKLATKSIENLSEEHEKQTVLNICSYAFENGKYDENILNYLIENYNGSTMQMYNVWKAGYEFQLNTTEIEERILVQSLFAESYVPDIVEIFGSYYRNYTNIKVVKAFLMYNSYKFIVRDRVLSETLFDILKKELVYQSNDLYTMAMLKYYSLKDTINDKEKGFIEDAIKYFGRSNTVLPFFKDFADKITLPEFIMDRFYIGYIADPDIDVMLCYRLEDDKDKEKYIQEKMRDVFYGIRVKEFILFYGDNLQYYVVEKKDDEEIITESYNICIDENIQDDETRYNKINFMLLTRSMNDEKTLIEAMKNLTLTDHIAANIFKPL